jgi:hypothetical protein
VRDVFINDGFFTRPLCNFLLKPVHDARIFGVRADGGMILALISLAVAFYVFVFFWLFGIDAGR